MTELKRTPLYSVIEKYGGKAIDFGGWELPVQFSSIKEEHEAVRKHAGLFDVSHMGEFTLLGTGAENYLQSILTNDVSKLKVGRAQYHIMCYPDGGTVDDLIIYRKAKSEFLIVVNASNVEKDFQWMMKHKPEDLYLANVSDHFAQVALQGPKAEEILQKMSNVNLSEISFFGFADHVAIGDIITMVARTGYTGEDGFEIYCDPKDAVRLWDTLVNAGAVPCGLGARDTLRFEACLPLYGQELSQTITPIEAGMGFAVRTDKAEDFIGKSVLKDQKENGAPRNVVGIEMIDRGIPRHGYPVFVGDKQIGEITTGTQSPTLGTNIGLALLEANYTELGTEITVEIRGKRLRATVVATPFYKRNRA